MKMKKLISFHKLVPHFTIWRLQLTYVYDGGDFSEDNYYFLTYAAAKRFMEKHEEQLKEAAHVILGGEPLWLL